MGASPGYLMACRKADPRPTEEFDLSRPRQVGVAGSPLPRRASCWVAEPVRPRRAAERGQWRHGCLYGPGSGLRAAASLGRARCRGRASAWTSRRSMNGARSRSANSVNSSSPRRCRRCRSVSGATTTEVACGRPISPSFRAFFGSATGAGSRRRGRVSSPAASDATLNRGGVRLGTGEFYRVLADVPGVNDSVVVHLEDRDGGPGRTPSSSWCRSPASRSTMACASGWRPRSVHGVVTSPRSRPHRWRAGDPILRTGKKLEIPVEEDSDRCLAHRRGLPGRPGRPSNT